jgi:tetratricopeptide (TPR) repeat protein
MKFKSLALLLPELIIVCSVAGLLIFLPLSIDRQLINETQSGKSFLFFLFIPVIFFIHMIGQALKKEVSWNITAVDILLVLFEVWVSLNKFLLQSTHTLSLRYFELIGLLALYLVIRTLNKKYHLFILLAVCAGGAIQAIYGNLQLWGFYPSHHAVFKLTGSFFNPGPFAGYLCCILPMAGGLYWSINHQGHKEHEEEKKRAKYQATSIKNSNYNLNLKTFNLKHAIINSISLIAIVSILLVLPATRSRAAWFGALAGVTFLAWHKYNLKKLFKPGSENGINLNIFRHSIKFQNRIFVVIFAVILLAGSVGLYRYKKNSADGRMLIWTVSTSIIKDYPLFGVGQDLFKAHYMGYQADYFRNHPNSKFGMVADDNQYGFNEALSLWAENGIIGLLIMMGLTAIAFSGRTKIDNAFTAAQQAGNQLINSSNQQKIKILDLIRASLISTLVFSMFSYPGEILPIKLIVVVCLGMLASYLAGKTLYFKPKPLYSMAIVCLALCLTGIAYLKTIELRQAHKTWKEAFDLYNLELYHDCLEVYDKAWPQLKNNGEYLINYGKALSVANQHTKAIEVLCRGKDYHVNTILYTALGDSYKTAGLFNEAEKAYRQAALMVPGKFYPLYLLAKLYYESGQNEKAVRMANILIKKQVKINSTAIEEMKAEMRKILEEYAATYSLNNVHINHNSSQKDRANHVNMQYTAMVALPDAPSGLLLSENSVKHNTGKEVMA